MARIRKNTTKKVIEEPIKTKDVEFVEEIKNIEIIVSEDLVTEEIVVEPVIEKEKPELEEIARLEKKMLETDLSDGELMYLMELKNSQK